MLIVLRKIFSQKILPAQKNGLLEGQCAAGFSDWRNLQQRWVVVGQLALLLVLPCQD